MAGQVLSAIDQKRLPGRILVGVNTLAAATCTILAGTVTSETADRDIFALATLGAVLPVIALLLSTTPQSYLNGATAASIVPLANLPFVTYHSWNLAIWQYAAMAIGFTLFYPCIRRTTVW